MSRSLGYFALTGLVLAFAAIGIRPLGDPDFGWHLRTGELVLHTGFTEVDPWSVSSTQPWILHEWGGEVIMYLAYLLAGYHGVIVLRTVLMLLLAFLLVRSCRRVAGPWITLAVVLLSLISLWPRATERPQLISFCILAILLPLLRQAVSRRRPAWWLVPVMIVWANVHAMWPVALAIYAALIVGMMLEDRFRSPRTYLLFAGSWILGLAGTLVNPSGWDLLSIFEPGGADLVSEFSTPSITDPINVTTVALAVIVAIVWARNERQVGWTNICYFVAVTGLAFIYSRTVPIAAIGLAPLAAEALSGIRRSGQVRVSIPRRDLVAIGVLTLVFVLAVAVRLQGLDGVYRDGRFQSARVLDAQPGHAKVLNEYDDGGWLIWAARDISVGVDGRVTVYGLPYVRNHRDATVLKPGWRRWVAAQQFDVAYLYQSTPLVQGLVQEGWTVKMRRDKHVLLLPPT